MKANAPKRKVFRDALDLLAEDPVQDTSVAVNGIVSIPVEEIHPFYDHPFRLYEGDRLEDMVQSIRAYGVLNPVIVRKAATVDVTDSMPVLCLIDRHDIRNWLWKNRSKRYWKHEGMHICGVASVGKQCSSLFMADDSGFSVWKRCIHWSRDYIRTN